MIDLAELDRLIAAYLATLPDDDIDDWCTSSRNFAQGELGRFREWLETRQQGIEQ